MHVKVMPYRKGHAQRVADLAALLRYLLVGRDGDPRSNHVARLAGPPVASRLIQRLSPFGATYKEAAYDLAQQLFEHARNGSFEGGLPFEVYKHFVISFPPGFVNREFADAPSQRLTRAATSEFAAVIRTVREFLDAAGIGSSVPQIIVIHDDRGHIHAHIAAAIYARGLDRSSALRRLTPPRIHGIAASVYAAHGWSFPYAALEDWYAASLVRPIARRFQGR